jgi:hypothetical protein
MNTPKPKPDIRLLVSTEDTNSFGDQTLRLTVNVVVLTDDGIRNPSFGWSDETGAGDLANLQVDAWLGKRDSTWLWPREVEYRSVYDVDLRRAESMVKTLRRINKRFNAMSERYGYPQDLAGWLNYLANAVGATKTAVFGYLVKRDPHTAINAYDDGDYRWVGVNELRYHLDKVARDWRDKHGIEVPA